MSKIIELKKVNKWFDKFQVLKDIDLEVNQQEKIVICGPSGSGKSTLIRCINRLEEHQEGNIIVDINNTVISGTPLQSSIKPIEIYFIAGKDDLLPNAKITPIGKQKSIAKAEIINVNERPPQAALSTYSNPKLPPEISLIPRNGKTKTRNKIKYFLSFSDTKNETPTIANKIRKAVFILHCSALG